ncbi:MAG: hypothetical protein ACFB4I_09555 [Cyanophyceae cyanobacterium]
MFYRILAAIALSLPLNSFLLAAAQEFPGEDYQPPHPFQSQPRRAFFEEPSDPSITIPASSAIAITFCSQVQFDAEEQESSFPTTVYLAQPITDVDGNILAPINSLVSAQVTPTDEGVQLHAEALVIGGQYISIETPVVSVPVLSRATEDTYYSSGYSTNTEQLGVGYNVARNLRDWLGLGVSQTTQTTTTYGTSYGSALTEIAEASGVIDSSTGLWLDAGLAVAEAVFMGMNNRSPKETRVTEVAQGVTIVFPLLAPVDVPPVAKLATQSSFYPVSQTAESPCTDGGGGFGGQPYYQINNGSNNYGNSPDGGSSGYRGAGYQPVGTENYD